MRLSATLRALAALLVLATATPAQNAPSTTVIVVRHAEKAAEPVADPALTPFGTARAQALVELVKDAGISAIISTQFTRTRNTIAPIAAKLGLTPEIVDARVPQHPKAVADGILAAHRGQTVLVVGHSNTVPDIVAALGAPKPVPICDEGYDNVYVVTVPATGPASVVQLHYGVAATCKG
jgi:broad specificity phosphatase PhoE